MNKFLLVLLSSMIVVSAQAQTESKVPSVSETDVLVTIDGKPAIFKSEYDSALSLYSVNPDTLSEEEKDSLIDDLVTRYLIEQEIKRSGFENSPEFKEAYRSFLMQMWFARMSETQFKPTEEEIKAAYDNYVAEAKVNPQKEYRVRHILLKTKEEADKLLADLKAKKVSFSDAVHQSLDTVSAQSDGDLDWSVAEAYVQPFAEAVKTAKVGELVSTPIHTQFGYHIVEVMDVRSKPQKTFEEMHDELEKDLSIQKTTSFIDNLRNGLKIDIKR